MNGIILFAEDYEILLTFVELLRKQEYKLKKKIEREDWYEYCGEKVELYSVLAGGYKNLVKKLKAFLENKILESIISKWIKNKGFEKVFIVVLYDKDKEHEIKDEIITWKEKFEKSFESVRKHVEIKYSGVGIQFKNFSSEMESYFLKREYEKNEISEEELEKYRKLLSSDKASLAFYLKQILKFKEKPSLKIYLERALKDEKLVEDLREQLLISHLI